MTLHTCAFRTELYALSAAALTNSESLGILRVWCVVATQLHSEAAAAHTNDEALLYMWRGSFVYVTWLFCICDEALLYMWRGSFVRLTQSIMYVPLQVNRYAEIFLLIVQYRYLKSCSGDFYSPESDAPHKIMRYWFHYWIWLGFSFPPHRICQVEMICIGGVPVSKRHFGGAGP